MSWHDGVIRTDRLFNSGRLLKEQEADVDPCTVPRKYTDRIPNSAALVEAIKWEDPRRRSIYMRWPDECERQIFFFYPRLLRVIYLSTVIDERLQSPMRLQNWKCRRIRRPNSRRILLAVRLRHPAASSSEPRNQRQAGEDRLTNEQRRSRHAVTADLGRLPAHIFTHTARPFAAPPQHRSIHCYTATMTTVMHARHKPQDKRLNIGLTDGQWVCRKPRDRRNTRAHISTSADFWEALKHVDDSDLASTTVTYFAGECARTARFKRHRRHPGDDPLVAINLKRWRCNDY